MFGCDRDGRLGDLRPSRRVMLIAGLARHGWQRVCIALGGWTRAS